MATPEEDAAAVAAQAEAEAAAIAEVQAEEEAKVEAEVKAEAEKLAAEQLAAGDAAGANAAGGKQTFQERINELTWKFRESERQTEHYRKIAEGNAAAPVVDADKPPVAGNTRPIATGYETVEAYEDALFGWYETKKSAAAATKSNEESIKVALGTFNKNAAPMRLQHKDFDEVINAPVFTDTMRKSLFTMDGGAMVAYHLGLPANRTLADEIKVLPPEQQVYKLSKLEDHLLLVQKAKTKTSSVNPLNPVGSNAAASNKNPEDMPVAEWMEWNKQQEIAKLKEKLGE